MRACLAAVEEHNERLNAFVHLDAEMALAEARAVDAAVRDGDQLGPLAGVPFGVKDLEDCAGMPTTRGSRWFADGPPKTADSLHVGRLRAAGAIPIGKTAAPEFGAWAYTASPLLGVTRNPWDPSVTPGGSSGGSTRGGVRRDGALRHGQRRRRVDPHPGRLHRAGGPALELRPHPHLRRHAPGPERRRGQRHHHRRRHRPAARRDGRPRRPRPHLPARAAGPLPRRARAARPVRPPRRVVGGPRLRRRRPRGRGALRAGRPRLRDGHRRHARRHRHHVRRLHADVRAHGRRRQVRRHRPRPLGAPTRRARPAVRPRLALPQPEDAALAGGRGGRSPPAGAAGRGAVRGHRPPPHPDGVHPALRGRGTDAHRGRRPGGPRRDVGRARLPRQRGEPARPQRSRRATQAGLPVGLQVIGPRHREDLVLAAAAHYERARPWPRHCLGHP